MKKRFVLGIIIVSFVMACVACRGPVAGAPDIGLETEVEVVDPLPRPEDEMVRLSYEELLYFDLGFFNRYITDDATVLPHSNMFLTCEYYTPLDIDMGMLFYNGIFGEDIPGVTEEERRLLVERYGTDILECGEPNRIPVESMNAVLMQYTGLTLEQTNKVGLPRYYLEEYQSYYSVAGDFAWPEIGVLDGWKNAQGTVVIRYDVYGDDEIWQVILHEKNGQYYIAANIKISSEDIYDEPDIDIAYPDVEIPAQS